MLEHLKHMANVRPEGLDRSAAVWAMTEIERHKRNEELQMHRAIRVEAALKKIAAYCRGGCLASDADEMIDIAREALNQ